MAPLHMSLLMPHEVPTGLLSATLKFDAKSAEVAPKCLQKGQALMETQPTPELAKTGRLQSIDALRGFDMFWIVGGAELFRATGKWLGAPEELIKQFSHVKWEGFRFYDLIFPLFLFIVGVVLPFSLAKYTDTEEGRSNARLVYRRIVVRTFLLIFCGFIYSGFLQFHFDDFRWPGVLQRIGLCYFFAAMAVLHLRVWGQVVLFAALLGGYWAMLRFIAVPGFEPYDLTREGNLAAYIDRCLIPGKLIYKFGDNEGLLSTIPAIGTTLLGALAGNWLRSSRSPVMKCVGLFVAAGICLGAGYGWANYAGRESFPLIKILWTSSFVLVTGGWSLILLWLFYLIIDVLGWRRWSFFFVVIGMNAITIYLMTRFVDFKKISEFFLGGVMEHSGSASEVVMRLGMIAAEWIVLYYLYRNKTFLRV